VFVRMRLIFFLAIALSAAGQTTDFLTWSYGVAQSGSIANSEDLSLVR